MISKCASHALQIQSTITLLKNVKLQPHNVLTDKSMIVTIKNVYALLMPLIGMENNALTVKKAHNGILKNIIV